MPHRTKLAVTKAVLFLLSIVILTSCGKNDPAPASIVGNWTVNAQAYKLTFNAQPFKDYLISKKGLSPLEAQTAVDLVTDDLNINNNFAGAIFNFKSDKTYSSQITYSGVKHTKFGKWSQSADGKTLKLTSDADPSDTMTATITNVTNKDLQIDLPGGTNYHTSYVVKYTVSVTAKRTGDGDTTPPPVMSRVDSLVGSWVISSYSYSAGTNATFDPTDRVFGFKEDGSWLDKASATKTYLGTWKLNPDGKTLTISEIDGDKTVGLTARIVGLSHGTLRIDFIEIGYTLSLALSRAG
jgi:uncharacterized protein (DUF2147 family)